MIAELDLVALTRDLSTQGLRRDDVGTVVHRYADGRAFEVEFVTTGGATVAVLTLDRADIRPFGDREILRVRDLAAAGA